MSYTKKWISYVNLLEHPENYGIQDPYKLAVVYTPSIDDTKILKSVSSLASKDIQRLGGVLSKEKDFCYYPIGEFCGMIYLTTDKVSLSAWPFDCSDYPNHQAHILAAYAQCHGNTNLSAIGCEWSILKTFKLLSIMPMHLKKLPTAFWTSIRFSKAVISGNLHNIPISIVQGYSASCLNYAGWQLSFRPLVALSSDVLVSRQDLVYGRPLRLKLPMRLF